MNKKRILFVDDEPKVLQGITRMLRSQRNEWEIATAESGEQALALLAASPFDLIVTDMRMPGMDGAQLLNEVMKQYPQIVRIVLSGQSDQESIFRSVGPTHQYLSKPCDAETLKNTVERACSLQDVLANDALRRTASQMQSLPSLPALYTEVLKELQSPEPAIERISRIISRDAGMTAKILQLVNSAFFGFYRRINDPVQAIMILGLEKIRSLALTVHIFSQIDQAQWDRFNLGLLWKHNLLVGQCARDIGQTLNPDKFFLEEIYMAGLLHDIGKIILMANLPKEYEQVLSGSRLLPGISDITAEYGRFGASHAEIGAYLLGLWGLSTPIVEAVAFHHQPSQCRSQKFSPLTAVHAANGLLHEAQLPDKEIPGLDMEYIESLNLTGKLPAWRQISRELAEKRVDL